MLEVEAFLEPRRRNADFPVGASRRLENRRYEVERVHGHVARPMSEVEALHKAQIQLIFILLFRCNLQLNGLIPLQILVVEL